MRADLRRLVELESPSDDPTALANCARFIAARARELIRGDVRVLDEAEGPHVEVRVGHQEHGAVLLLGHFDTVWPCGTLGERPYQERDGIATGPGVFDMKAGIVQCLWALSALQQLDKPAPPLRLFLNSDEELQSRRSRAHIVEAAQSARAVLVVEPSENGALKISRKGSGRFEIIVHGRAAHAGVDPAAGRSAISELARIIRELDAMTDLASGISVNVGVVEGGTRANVVAERARAIVDVRAVRQLDAKVIAARIGSIQPSRDGISVEVRGGFGRPPMERTPQTEALFRIAEEVGSKIGLDVRAVASGGASDANLCAGLGAPILDGLGAVGGGAHAVDEHVLIEEMPVRAALLAGVISALS